MAEAWRKEEEPLTTADIAGTKTTPVEETRNLAASDAEADGGPRLVRNGTWDADTEAMAAGSTAAPQAVSAANRNAGVATSANPAAAGTPLLSDTELTELRTRWSDIQAGFVDEPRHAVEEADQLVASAIQRLAEGFARERASLETQWEKGSDVSTEDLRLALQRYRSFFGRLLNAA